MRMRRTIGALIVLLTFAAPDLLVACGDKFLVAARFTRYKRPKHARAASVLIYNPASPMAPKPKVNIESVLKFMSHRTHKVKTLQELWANVLNGHYDVILTSNAYLPSVKGQHPSSPDAPAVLATDDLMENYSLLREIDQLVVQRDQELKKTHQQQKKKK